MPRVPETKEKRRDLTCLEFLCETAGLLEELLEVRLAV